MWKTAQVKQYRRFSSILAHHWVGQWVLLCIIGFYETELQRSRFGLLPPTTTFGPFGVLHGNCSKEIGQISVLFSVFSGFRNSKDCLADVEGLCATCATCGGIHHSWSILFKPTYLSMPQVCFIRIVLPVFDWIPMLFDSLCFPDRSNE